MASEFSEITYGGNTYIVKDKTARDNITNLNVGGTNHLRGSGTMESGDGTWSTGTWRKSGSGTVEFGITNDDSYNGNKIVSIKADSAKYGGFCQDQAILGANTYTFSVWAKATVTGVVVYIQGVYDITTKKSYGIKKTTTTDTAWHKYSVTFTLPNSYKGGISVGYVYIENGAEGDVLYVHSPKLEIGSVATDWSPNPLDDLNAVAAAAVKLKTARTIKTNLASTTAASFNGTANVTPGVTGILPVANGGTGKSTAADARSNLSVYSKDEVDAKIPDLGIASIEHGSIDVTYTGSNKITNLTSLHTTAIITLTNPISADKTPFLFGSFLRPQSDKLDFQLASYSLIQEGNNITNLNLVIVFTNRTGEQLDDINGTSFVYTVVVFNS